MKKSELSIILGLILTLVITYISDTNVQAAQIRQQTLRLHIIAQDDGNDAQNIKMRIKEEITSIAPEIYCNAKNFEDAVKIAENNLDFIQQITDNALKNLGADYTSHCSMENFYFDTTEYDGFTMPRGEYTALTIRLGKASGKNWWCVIYPTLCSATGGEYEDDDANTFIETEKFRIKFKAVELWQKFVNTISDNSPEVYDKIE